MKKTLLILALMTFTLLVFWYFSNENAFTAPPRKGRPESLVFKTERYEKTLGDCPKPDQRCLYVKMEYPVALGGTDSLREAINDYFMELLVNSVLMGDSEEPILFSSIDSAVADLAEVYSDFVEETPDIGMSWEIENTGSVDYNSDRMVTVSLQQYSFTGGAHPNTFLSIANFDKENGRMLGLADLVSDTTALKNLLEKKFRTQRELKPDEDLEAAGYWFPEGKFAFPANFGVVTDGLWFYYNPYEITAYALGPTEIVIPKKELKSLRKEW